MSTSVGVQDPGPSNQAGLEDISTRSMPDIEVMRDADPETEVMRDAFPHPEDIPSWIDPKDDKLEPDIAVMDEVMNEQDNHTPNVEFNLSDGSRPTERREEPISAALEQEPANSGSHNVTGGFKLFHLLCILYWSSFICIVYLKMTPFQLMSM